ncbi:MAG: aldo/keto reductase [Saprospiraceae bacterium]|nr:aldo/keto reductase [Saprospiraceae bacterium]
MSKLIYENSFLVGCMRLGAWGAKYNTNEYETFIDECLNNGLSDFDHADIYGDYTTEIEFGEVIKKRPDLKNKVQITTKCGIKHPCDQRAGYTVKAYDSSPEHILESVDNSLSNLGIDQIKVLLLHRPDFLMDVNAIADVFKKLSNSGKVKYFGVSNFSMTQFDLLNQKYPLVTNQIEISLFHLNAFLDGTLDQCQNLKIQPAAWSPLGGGKLWTKSEDVQDKKLHEVLNSMQIKYNCTSSQLLLAWLLKHPSGIIPVLGTSKSARVIESLKAMDINLCKEDWYVMLESARGHEVA